MRWRNVPLLMCAVMIISAADASDIGAGTGYYDNLPAYIKGFLDKPTYEKEEAKKTEIKIEAEEPPPYRNPLMSYAPYVYIKGGIMYRDFAGLPDYGQYARLNGAVIALYPTEERQFYLVGFPEVTYSYKTKIIDYFSDGADTLKKYKAFIQTLGFTNKKKFESAAYEEYADTINWQLKYDPDFKTDEDGIFMVEEAETFRWLLIGKSVNYNGAGKLQECVEFRFYSLTRSPGSGRGILSAAEDLTGTSSPVEQEAFLFTPNAADDIGLTGPSVGTPVYSTPSAVDDIKNILTVPVVSPVYPTPDAAGDIKDGQYLGTVK